MKNSRRENFWKNNARCWTIICWEKEASSKQLSSIATLNRKAGFFKAGRGYSFDRWKLSNERRIFASYYTHIRWIHCSYALKLRNSGRNELFDRSKTDMSSSQSQRPLILMARAKQVSILLPPPPPFESIDATNDPWRREFEKRRR